MAAAEYTKLLFVLRPERAHSDSSPAALRLWVAPAADKGDALEVRALKRRGPPLSHALHLAARPSRLARLLAASECEFGHALDRTAASF